jgi:hypothetical protein
MLDGYPIYGPLGTDQISFDKNDHVKILNSSFGLKYTLEISEMLEEHPNYQNNKQYYTCDDLNSEYILEIRRGSSISFESIENNIYLQLVDNDYIFVGEQNNNLFNNGVKYSNKSIFFRTDEYTPEELFLVSTDINIIGFKIKIINSGKIPTEKYEYIPNLGELDICNGIYSATAEYPNGCYHYIMTIKSNYDGTTYKEIDSNYGYENINNEKPIISPEYPYITTSFRSDIIGKINNFT